MVGDRRRSDSEQSKRTINNKIRRLEEQIESLSEGVSQGRLALQLVSGIGEGTGLGLGAVELLVGQTTSSTNVNTASPTTWQVLNSGTFTEPLIGEVSSSQFVFARSGFYLVIVKVGLESRGTADCIVEGYPRVNGNNLTNRPIFVSSRSPATSGQPFSAVGQQVREFSSGDTFSISTAQKGAAGNVYDYKVGGLPLGRVSIVFLRGA